MLELSWQCDISLFFYWNCPDSVVFCCFSWRTVPKSNRKTTQYHTVRTVPIEKQQNTTLSGQFQHWNCPDSVVLCYFSIGTVLTVWYFVVFHRCWKWPDSVLFCCFSIGTVLTVWYCVFFLLTTQYHTVRTVPIEKQQNTTLSGQFQHLWKTTKYHTVRTVPIEK
jgi:hypothetical protein